MTLPLLDVHERTVPATPAQTWLGLLEFVRRELLTHPGPALGAVLGIPAESGWTVSHLDAGHRLLRVEGRHRFARYAIDFTVRARGGHAVVRAASHAEFLGPMGRAYRRLVVSSRFHVLATRWLLRRVEVSTGALGGVSAGASERRPGSLRSRP